MFDAAVAAAHPDVVLASFLRPVPKGKVICLAAGKGAAAMAAAAERHYLDALEQKAGIAIGSVKLMVVATETPAAMFALGSYAPAHPRRCPVCPSPASR